MLCNDAELFQEEGSLEGRGRSDRGRALSVRDQARHGPAGRAGGLSAHRRHPLRIGTQVHGDAAQDGGRHEDAVRQGRAGGDPRATAIASRWPAATPRRSIASVSCGSRTGSRRRASGCWASPGSENPGVNAGSLGPADLPKTLVLLGLVGLLDPPRKEAIEAVKECHGGGIRVTMITGDHKITAAAIAKMLGIGDGKTAVTGTEIEEMDDRSAAGARSRRRRLRARQSGAQAPAGEGDPGEQADRGDDGRRRERRALR